MKKFCMLASGFAAVALLGVSGAAQADDTGVAQALHSLTRSGGRLCLLDHYHDGSGSGSTRGGAQAAAIRAWSDFTSWEYGTSWGRFGAAASKTVNCSGGGRSWSCSVSARPCRG